MTLPPPGAASTPAWPQVVLVEGLTPAARDAVLRGPHHEGGAHLLSALKFVAARYSREGEKRGVLGALGGPWDPDMDGGEPDRCELMAVG